MSQEFRNPKFKLSTSGAAIDGVCILTNDSRTVQLSASHFVRATTHRRLGLLDTAYASMKSGFSDFAFRLSALTPIPSPSMILYT
jgi:hypothetical protein